MLMIGWASIHALEITVFLYSAFCSIRRHAIRGGSVFASEKRIVAGCHGGIDIKLLDQLHTESDKTVALIRM
ncbi:MAG: hypothetical protein CMP07_06275 [Xanthomonadales bacterium]|nr:hypothetical protein [Xanthomonadales bacterium]|tara:strand:+ start:682 stop:897 length:216 start_codon:yes stop_codon:yes gene_type:complete